MEEIHLDIKIEQYAMEELSDSEQELVRSAIKATHNAYANYSRFYVGAALRLANGQIVIFAAQSQQPEQPITTLAIAASNDEGLLKDPITPCGACRQVILEMEDRYKRPVRILLFGARAVYAVNSVKDLLPLSFVDANMR